MPKGARVLKIRIASLGIFLCCVKSFFANMKIIVYKKSKFLIVIVRNSMIFHTIIRIYVITITLLYTIE